MDKNELANLRRDYAGQPLSKSSVDSDPFIQFNKWFDEALSSEITDANAMLLSTVDADCRPSSRVVLLKAVDENGFVFFTNYKSKKSSDIANNPSVSLTFFWPQLQRQVHVLGLAEKVSVAESETYFNSRPYDSQIGAWASEQSSVIESRTVLESEFDKMRQRFRDDVPLPPFWGGYRVMPSRIEFWQGRASRLHDRLRYRLSGDEWLIERLSP
jgi:pyridoxamine 5'-phosphate oxidase